MRLTKRWGYISILVLVLAGLVWHFFPTLSASIANANAHKAHDATTPIKNVVVIMMENHTFDNLFGTFPGANGDANLAHASDPLHNDLGHGTAETVTAVDYGKMDGFPARSYIQYQQQDIPNYWFYAQHFGLSDDFFSSIASSSTPNHLAMVAAQTGGLDESIGSDCTYPANSQVYSENAKGTPHPYWSFPCYNINSTPQELTKPVSVGSITAGPLSGMRRSLSHRLRIRRTTLLIPTSLSMM